jgi:hypothetical protein
MTRTAGPHRGGHSSSTRVRWRMVSLIRGRKLIAAVNLAGGEGRREGEGCAIIILG